MTDEQEQLFHTISMDPNLVSVSPILDDIFPRDKMGEVEKHVEIWREQSFPEYDIDDIHVRIQLTKRGEDKT